jgi:hypothetical protein
MWLMIEAAFKAPSRFTTSKRFLLNPDLAGVIIARDITREKFPWLGADDFLTTVFERLRVMTTNASRSWTPMVRSAARRRFQGGRAPGFRRTAQGAGLLENGAPSRIHFYGASREI